MIEQQGLRTPMKPSFGNAYIHGIRGLAFASAFTRRSRAAKRETFPRGRIPIRKASSLQSHSQTGVLMRDYSSG